MIMVGQQCPTPTGPQQRPNNHQYIPPLQINTAGIPIYQIGALETQALLTNITTTAVGDTHVISQESKTNEVSTELKVSEGEKQRIKKIAD